MLVTQLSAHTQAFLKTNVQTSLGIRHNKLNFLFIAYTLVLVQCYLCCEGLKLGASTAPAAKTAAITPQATLTPQASITPQATITPQVAVTPQAAVTGKNH